jgi:hypothetical protein
MSTHEASHWLTPVPAGISGGFIMARTWPALPVHSLRLIRTLAPLDPEEQSKRTQLRQAPHCFLSLSSAESCRDVGLISGVLWPQPSVSPCICVTYVKPSQRQSDLASARSRCDRHEPGHCLVSPVVECLPAKMSPRSRRPSATRRQ